MAMVFQIVRAGRNIRISSMKVWLYISLYGRIKLGTFGDCDYYAFKCPNHPHLIVDMEHGYEEGRYYHECPTCKYRMLLRESE